MKVILEFNMAPNNENQFEEEQKLKLCLSATDMSIALWDISQLFRNELKYNENLSESEYKLLERLQSNFLETLDDNNIRYILNI